FKLFGLLLPKDRTGLYIVPLATLLVATIAAVPAEALAGRVNKAAITAMLILIAAWYAGCFRVSHFKEWAWDADVKSAYEITARYHHRCGLATLDADGLYAGPLNAYLEMSGRESFPSFEVTSQRTPGQDIYVLDGDRDRDYIDQNHLQIVYRASESGLVV